MKGKIILVVFLLTSVCQLFSLEYDINKLKVVAKVWGETYLFHPAIVQDSQKIDWEKQLVDFLPNLKKTNSSQEFIALLNDSLLSCLGDDFTFVSSGKDGNHAKAVFNITDNRKFDYLRIDSDDFGNIENLNKIDSVINDRDSNKPLVVDVRLTGELGIDYHTYNFFEYFVSMLINEPVMLSPMVSREHFGWDEYNDWWFYEQRWKVANKDVDIISNGKLLPYADYIPVLNQYNPDFNSENFKTITRPIVFITNKTFDSYYGELLSDIRLKRKNTFIIGEDTGEVIIAPNSNLKKYGFKDFDFVLNPALSVSNNRSGLIYDLKCNDVTNERIIDFLKSDKRKLTDERPLFLFNISPVRYVSSGDSLTLEEKLAGGLKLYTVIKYFHIYKDEIAEKWDKSFEEYLNLVQNTNSDKEYFDLIQTMLTPLNDSHVFVEHESMLDFASLFVPPVMFEWIENKAIVTAFDPELKDILFLGDEVLAIDDVSISEMIEQKRVNVSHANEQSLISIAVTPANFTGTENSPVKFKIKRNNEDMVIDLKKNTFVFYILGMGIKQINPVQVMDNNIGYLNLAYLTDSESLNVGVEQIKNTDGLIIDLRNSYPTISFYDFLQLFCNKKTAIRQDAVPIVSADASMVQSSISWCFPKDKNLYNKPVVVLIDKTMMSRPEDIAIALKAFDNVTFVGEQTQGTDGEMTRIYLPGNGTVSFTGQLVKFGNGDDFQGVGIMPDIHVERTIEGVKNGEDEILNKALSLFQ